jgi:hypothetical protein
VKVERVEQDLDNVSTDGEDGGLTVLETASDSDHDVITGFQRDADVIAFDGDLLARMGNRDDVDFTFITDAFINNSTDDTDLELDLTGVVLVSREVNRATSHAVDADDLNEAEDVAMLLNDIFDFSAGKDGVLNTTVFNIVADNNKHDSALWVHTQAYDDDNTVEAEELTLLALVKSAQVNPFGIAQSVDAFDHDNFAMSHLFPTNQAYTVLPPV